MEVQQVSFNHEQVEQVLQKGFRLLRFPHALEHAFVRANADQRTVKLILAGLNAVLIFAAILLTDYLVDPSTIRLAICLRIGVFAPSVLLLLFVLHRAALPQVNEWMVVPIAVLASVLIVRLAAAGQPDLVFPKTMELLIVVVYVSVFTRFWPMLLLSGVILLLDVQVTFSQLDIARALQMGSTLLLLTSILFALHACYTREHNDRLSFLLGLHEQAMRASIRDGNQRLADMARTDTLTGIPNRRAFDELLTQHLAHDGGHAMALMLIDIDHFKAFNDRYGHQAGDRCLKDVVETVASCLRRPVDMIARWGGEEFAVLLAEADEEVARQVAERICAAVADRDITHAGSISHPCVTVSVGVALTRTGDATQHAALLQAADNALYRAKALGRHRYVVAGSPEADEVPC